MLHVLVGSATNLSLKKGWILPTTLIQSGPDPLFLYTVCPRSPILYRQWLLSICTWHLCVQQMDKNFPVRAKDRYIIALQKDGMHLYDQLQVSFIL